MKKRIATPPKISKAWISPSPIGGIAVEPLVLALGRLEQLEPADHLRERRVLDDVHEQADERRQQPAKRLRQDHRRVAAHPAEAERRGALVLLARDRLDRAARRLGDLRAAPQDERDRRSRERVVELEPRRHRGQAEVDDEDGDEDRQAAEDLDVEPDQRLQRQEADRHQRPEDDPDQRCCRRPRSQRRAGSPAAPRRGCTRATGSTQSGI